ncbi:MAG: hypothetical protein M1819_006662 [Sarea resinae]|nr:MAG: hypothetical protein M1819_006662 [Sarea resinae]
MSTESTNPSRASAVSTIATSRTSESPFSVEARIHITPTELIAHGKEWLDLNGHNLMDTAVLPTTELANFFGVPSEDAPTQTLGSSVRLSASEERLVYDVEEARKGELLDVLSYHAENCTEAFVSAVQIVDRELLKKGVFDTVIIPLAARSSLTPLFSYTSPLDATDNTSAVETSAAPINVPSPHTAAFGISASAMIRNEPLTHNKLIRKLKLLNQRTREKAMGGLVTAAAAARNARGQEDIAVELARKDKDVAYTDLTRDYIDLTKGEDDVDLPFSPIPSVDFSVCFDGFQELITIHLLNDVHYPGDASGKVTLQFMPSTDFWQFLDLLKQNSVASSRLGWNEYQDRSEHRGYTLADGAWLYRFVRTSTTAVTKFEEGPNLTLIFEHDYRQLMSKLAHPMAPWGAVFFHQRTFTAFNRRRAIAGAAGGSMFAHAASQNAAAAAAATELSVTHISATEPIDFDPSPQPQSNRNASKEAYHDGLRNWHISQLDNVVADSGDDYDDDDDDDDDVDEDESNPAPPSNTFASFLPPDPGNQQGNGQDLVDSRYGASKNDKNNDHDNGSNADGRSNARLMSSPGHDGTTTPTAKDKLDMSDSTTYQGTTNPNVAAASAASASGIIGDSIYMDSETGSIGLFTDPGTTGESIYGWSVDGVADAHPDERRPYGIGGGEHGGFVCLRDLEITGPGITAAAAGTETGSRIEAATEPLHQETHRPPWFDGSVPSDLDGLGGERQSADEWEAVHGGDRGERGS